MLNGIWVRENVKHGFIGVIYPKVTTVDQCIVYFVLYYFILFYILTGREVCSGKFFTNFRKNKLLKFSQILVKIWLNHPNLDFDLYSTQIINAKSGHNVSIQRNKKPRLQRV